MLDRMKEKRHTLEAYKKFFTSEDGKLILKDLIRSTKFFDTTFHTDQSVMAFEEGQRALVLRILRSTKVKQEDIERMFEDMLKH